MNERQQLEMLNKKEKAFLAKHQCLWCGMSLNRPGCGEIYKRCDETTRIERRQKCLRTYRPRKLANKSLQPTENHGG